MGGFGGSGPVLQPLVGVERLVELLPFFVSYNRDGCDDVYMHAGPFCFDLSHELVFVQTRKRQRIVKLM
jgi:hypothetical protein